jgi:hypothetical protein
VELTTSTHDAYCYIEGGGVFAWATRTIAAREPSALSRSADDFTYTSFGNYNRYIEYQIWDNYDLPWTYAGYPVTESYDKASDGCNLTIETGGGPTNGEGRFYDNYGTLGSTIPACAVVPQCETVTTQHISVAGHTFYNSVIWRCSGVDVY